MNARSSLFAIRKIDERAGAIITTHGLQRHVFLVKDAAIGSVKKLDVTLKYLICRGLFSKLVLNLRLYSLNLLGIVAAIKKLI